MKDVSCESAASGFISTVYRKTTCFYNAMVLACITGLNFARPWSSITEGAHSMYNPFLILFDCIYYVCLNLVLPPIP